MTTLTFQTTNLSVITKHNQTFLTASDLGLALGYSDSVRSIKTIYDRNQDEFTTGMTALVDIKTAGGIQKVRVFSLRGAHLIAMFARTKVAKNFRKWVLDILDREIDQQATITPAQQQAIQSAVQQAHHRTGLHWQEIYRQIKAVFHVAKYDQLPQDKFNDAMAFINGLQVQQQDNLKELEQYYQRLSLFAKAAQDLIKAAKPFIHGNLIANAEFQLSRSKKDLAEIQNMLMPNHLRLIG